MKTLGATVEQVICHKWWPVERACGALCVEMKPVKMFQLSQDELEMQSGRCNYVSTTFPSRWPSPFTNTSTVKVSV